MQELRDIHSDELAVLLISSEPEDTQRPFLEQHGLTVDAAVDYQSRIANRYGIGHLPTTILISSTGRVVHVGFPSSLDSALAELRIGSNWPEAPVTRDRVNCLLDGRRHYRVIELLRRGLIEPEAGAIVGADAGLRGFCAARVGHERDLAARAILVEPLFGRSYDSVDPEMWRAVRGSSWTFEGEVSNERIEPIVGVGLDGWQVDRSNAREFYRARIGRYLVMSALNSGQHPVSPPSDGAIDGVESAIRTEWEQRIKTRSH